MDKNTLQTYEFLPSNNAEAVRFFVVQNDGNLQILTKPLQYVTQDQVNNEEQEVQSCAVYNVESQQFYVNVDNSTELVSEEYILPPTNTNVYANNYLLQPDVNRNTQEEEVTHVTSDELKSENLPVANMTLANKHKQSDDCAEVTISDEQYKTLEQKGWIRLESNDKIFVLDTLSLHDITANDKLIQKFNSESNNYTETDATSFGKTQGLPDVRNDEFFNEYDAFDNTNASPKPNPEHIEIYHGVENNEENCGKQYSLLEGKVDLITNSNNIAMDDTIEVTKEQNGSAYKIKTKMVFKDIPNKIILGKTKNGKRLVAKVVKTREPMTISGKIMQNQKLSGTDLSNTQFIGLLKNTLRSNGSTYSSEDVSAAEAVVGQLFKVPDIRQSIMGQNLIITKIKNSEENTGKLKRKLTLVAGKVKLLDNNQGSFTHLPNLLQCLFMKSEKMDEDTDTNEIDNTERKDDITIFHVHESETVCEDNSVRVDINLTKRQLAIDSIVDRRLLKTYACGACAAIFNTDVALKEHRENLCLGMSNNLTIKTDNIPQTTTSKAAYTMVISGSKKIFCCLQCNTRFSTHRDCQNHVKTHFLPTSLQKLENKKNIKAGKSQLYKCKMCPASFIVPSTLSKHILTKHIRLKIN